MSRKYCVFLRGINVNGISIKMDALKEAFRQMNFSQVQTVLATGNIIAVPPEESAGEDQLKALIEAGLSAYFQYDAHVFLYSGDEIAHIHASAQSISVPEGCHLYVLLCDDTEALTQLSQLFASMPRGEQEQWIVSPHGAFWIVPKGSTLSSEFGSKALGDKRYKSKLTSRNMNTIEKIYKML
ncbi:MAG: hypothetical protein K0R57_1942 [Paenibacillaceae bacterium]|jgi:uncharacterized protein (DUF1697 family)|nr:hypothetical protein [Paenibacillaceae bacterium]